jgi:hypothetical protein
MANDDTKRTAQPRGWVRLYKYLPSNPKIIALRDSEFRAYIYALALAEDEQVRGRWVSRAYLAAAIGKRSARHIDRLVELDLLTEYDDGMVGVHAFDYWNPVDASNRERQARWYENNKREAVGLPRLYADGRNAVTPNVANTLDTHRQTRQDKTDQTDEIVGSAAGSSPDGPPALPSFDAAAYDAEVAARWATRNP